MATKDLARSLLLCTVLPAALWAQASAAEAPTQPWTVTDLAWLTGSWRGQFDGTLIEETWSPDAGGVLMGMFRWLGGAGLAPPRNAHLYELLLIEPRGRELVMTYRHFDPELRPHEEEFPLYSFVLRELHGQEAVFEREGTPGRTRLTYRRDGDRLVATLDATSEAETHSVKLEFRKQ
jgi:hypothetical protein